MTTKISHDSETPAQGQQVMTACAVIHHNFDGVEKIFLPKRADTKKFLPGVYEIPGGHIDFGEDIVEGLKREIREELGVSVNVGDPFVVRDYTNLVKGSHSAEIIYFASLVDPPEAITLHPEDHSSYVWISNDELGAFLTSENAEDDPGLIPVQKAFDLLEGGSPNFAS